MSAEDTEELCEDIAREINDEFQEFEGYEVRADAGSLGVIYVAIREAKHEIALGEKLADRLAPILEQQLEGRDLDFGVSLGTGDEDLLLQVQIRAPQQR